jgi:hypothetical protein
MEKDMIYEKDLNSHQNKMLKIMELDFFDQFTHEVDKKHMEFLVHHINQNISIKIQHDVVQKCNVKIGAVSYSDFLHLFFNNTGDGVYLRKRKKLIENKIEKQPCVLIKFIKNQCDFIKEKVYFKDYSEKIDNVTFSQKINYHFEISELQVLYNTSINSLYLTFQFKRINAMDVLTNFK